MPKLNRVIFALLIAETSIHHGYTSLSLDKGIVSQRGSEVNERVTDF